MRIYKLAWMILLLVCMTQLGCGSKKPGANPNDPAPEPPSIEPVEPVDEPPAISFKLAEPVARLSDEELNDGWISLFDGQTLFGWKSYSDANWSVEDGTIVVDSGDKGLLCTTSRFANYTLKVEFKSAKGTNSGIFLNTAGDVTDPAKDCYELNIADSDNPFPSGSLVKRLKAEGKFDSDQWQSYEVTVNQGKVVVNLDGNSVLEYTDPAPLPRGFIGLQLNEGRVAFRNIKLKPLAMEAIFNGKDLSGWKTYPDMDSVYSVTENGEMSVENGPGQIETEESYSDFILQLQSISHAPDLNSGLFFRCIPGEQMNGYECQISNSYNNGDRSQPADCGTGGIFRRQDARYVAGDDNSWGFITLIADGAHIAAWSNGIQVSDWTDDRKADPNPRKGLRLEAGTIMIQGHDPTTNYSFREIKIAK